MSAFFERFVDGLPFIPGIIFAFFAVFILHELGHYWAARLRRMKVESFSVGLGRQIWHIRDRHGTDWIFRIFPLGGHVEISDLNLEKETQSRRSVWTRLFVVLAGPGMNFLTPFIVLPLCYLLIGMPIRPPILSAVESGTPAAAAGLQRGDIVTHVDRYKILSYDDLGEAVEASKGRPLLLGIERQGQPIEISVTPKHEVYDDISNISRDHYRLGVFNSNLPLPLDFVRRVDGVNTKDKEDLARSEIIKKFGQPIILGVYGADKKIHDYPLTLSKELNSQLFDSDHKYYSYVHLGPLTDNAFAKISLFEAIQRGSTEAIELFGYIMTVPLQIFPIDPKLFVERIPFMSETQYYYESLIYKSLYTLALISIVIGFVNLLPLPRFDGSFVLYYVLEAIQKRRPTRRERAISMAAILFGLYALMLFANMEDIPGYIELKMDDLQKKLNDFQKD